MNKQQKTHNRNRRYNRRHGLTKLEGIDLRAQNKLRAKRVSDGRERQLEKERGNFVHVAHRFTASISELFSRRGMMTPRKVRKLRGEGCASSETEATVRAIVSTLKKTETPPAKRARFYKREAGWRYNHETGAWASVSS